MSIPASALPQTVTVVWSGLGATDAYGDPAKTEMGRRNRRARLWQLASREVTQGRDVASDQWQAIFEPTCVIDAGDSVEYDGKVFQVDGTPDTVFARHRPHHIEARLTYQGPVT